MVYKLYQKNEKKVCCTKISICHFLIFLFQKRKIENTVFKSKKKKHLLVNILLVNILLYVRFKNFHISN